MLADTTTRTNPSMWDVGNWKIRPKLTLFFTLVAILPVIVVGTLIIMLGRTRLLGDADIRLRATSENSAERIDASMVEGLQYVTVASRLPELVRFMKAPNDGAARTAAFSTLKIITAKAPDYETIALVDRGGTIILSSAEADLGTNMAVREYFVEAMKDKPVISDPLISLVTNRPVMVYAAPVKDEQGNVLGIIRSRLNLTTLSRLVEGDLGAEGNGSFAMLLDENGIRLADSRSKINPTVLDKLLYRAIAPLSPAEEKKLVDDQRFGKNAATKIEVLPLPEIADAVAKQHTGGFDATVDLDGTRHRAVISNLVYKPWRYVLVAPISTFTEVADRSVVLVLGASAIALVIAVIIAINLSRAITVPITKLSSVADRISLGELDAKIEVTSKDEIGELAEAVSRMQASLQAAIERLRARRSG